ncbi:MAG: phosphatase PAP2 family protein [Candidatus Riflebacteria bacterium]|nr:phosphatase PAP2 family protein [Candidatus Riflebacteria bacterium]
MKILARFRFEEMVFLIFFSLILFLSISEGEIFLHLYGDRFTHAFSLVLMIVITIKLHFAMYSMEKLDWRQLGDSLQPVLRGSRDFLSLYMCLAMYSSMEPILALRPLADQWLIKADRFIFGTDPGLLLESWITPNVTKGMVFAYLALFFYLPLVFFTLLARERQKDLRIFVARLSLSLFLGYLGYFLVPAVGPMYSIPQVFTKSLWSNDQTVASRQVLEILVDLNRLPRDCFPSMHACLAVIPLLTAFTTMPLLFLFLLPGVILLLISTVYLRYHYAVDTMAGVLLAIFCFWAGPRLAARWNRLAGRDES